MEGAQIDISNNGEIWRDFTWIIGQMRVIRLFINAVPSKAEIEKKVGGLSSVGHFWGMDIGSSDKVPSLDSAEAIVEKVSEPAIRGYVLVKAGGAPAN